MCLFALKYGTSYRDVLAAHSLCNDALSMNKRSLAASKALDSLENSWALRRARVYDYVQGLRRRWNV